MPRYTVQAPDGRTVTLEGDAPPTDQDLDEIFASLGPGDASGGVQRAVDAGLAPMSSHGPTPKSVTTRAAEWLPTVMGAGYGMASKVPVVGTGLAFLGGAGGEGYRQAIEGGRRLMGYAPEGDLPDSFWGQVQAMGKEGAIQAGSEGVGRGIGKMLGVAGSSLYRKLLKPSLAARLLPKAEQTVQTGLEYGINPFSPKSLARVEPEISRLGQEVEQIIANHPGGTAGPYPRSPLPVAQRVTKTAQKFAAPGADPADRAAAALPAQQFLDDLTTVTTTKVPTGAIDAAGRPITQNVTTKKLGMMTGKDILEARRAAGRSAGANSFGTATRSAETEARKELYHELGNELGDMYGGQVRGRMGLESRLIDLKDAATMAAERARNAGVGISTLRHGVPAAIGLGTLGSGQDPAKAVGYWMLAEMASNPRILARTALMMHGAGGRAGQGVLAQLPRGFWQLARSSNAPSPDPELYEGP